MRLILMMILPWLLVACDAHPEEDFYRLAEIDSQINAELVGVATDTGSERTVVRQFQYGDVDFLGNKEVVVTEQYIHKKDEFDLEVGTHAVAVLPLSWYHQTLDDMWLVGDQTACYGRQTEDFNNSELKRMLEVHDLGYAIGCPLTDDGGGPIGILSVVFTQDQTKNKIKIVDRVRTSSEKIEKLLVQKRDIRN